MGHVSIRAIMSCLFGGLSATQALLMLKACFDDSGSHDDSRIAVWGGIIGSVDVLETLDRKWRQLLGAPIEGKSPLAKFSLSHCVNGWNEFKDYSGPERELVRRKFRDLIAEADLAPIAHIVFVQDWNAALSPLERQFLGRAQNVAFKGCLDMVGKIAHGSNQPISCHFDKGQSAADVHPVLAAWEYTNPQVRDRVSVTFSAVAALTGLQAADTIAYEAYQYGLHLLDPKANPLSPHFLDIIERAGALFMCLDRKAIESFLAPFRAVLAQNWPH